MKSFKSSKTVTFVLALVLAMSFSVIAYAAEQTVTIFHTNDIHGRFVGTGSTIGVDVVATIRQETPNALLIDAGDTLHGLPFVTINRGADAVDLMSLAGFDLFTPGNHDFNYGYQRLIELAQRATFDVVSANIRRNGENLFTPYVVRDVGDVKIGFFGLTTPDTAFLTNPADVVGIEFADIITSAETAVAALQEEGAHVIVAIVHLGITEDRGVATSVALAEAVGAIDVIIDGHSHSQLDNGLMVNNVLIASASDYLEFLGRVTITVDTEEGVVTERAATLMSHEEAMEFEPHPVVSARIEAILAEQNEVLSEVVATIGTTLSSARAPGVRTQEMPLGNLVADAIKAGTNADVVLINGGGLRADLVEGEITRGDIIAVLPFGNYGVTLMVSPYQFRMALENAVSVMPDESGRFPQVSGFSFVFDVNRPAGSRVTSITMNGEELDLANTEATILLATNDFMSVGGDEFTVFVDIPTVNEFAGLDEMLLNFMRSATDLNAVVEGRIVMVEGEAVAIEAVVEEEVVEEVAEVEEAVEEVEEITQETEEVEYSVVEPAPAVAVVVEGNRAEVVRAWFLNVRSGAGIDHNPVGVLVRGDVVNVLDTRFGWMLIVSGDLQGWSYSGYLEIVE